MIYSQYICVYLRNLREKYADLSADPADLRGFLLLLLQTCFCLLSEFPGRFNHGFNIL